MEALRYLWNLAPLGGLLVVVAAIIYAVVRVRRSRRAGAAEQSAQALSSEAGAEDALDSSHIGFAPLVSAFEPSPHDRSAVAAGDAKQK